MTYKEWQQLGEEKGWHIEEPSHWSCRLPLVRHIRWLYYSAMLVRHINRAVKCGHLPIPRDYDLWVLAAIRYGKQ